VAEGEWCGSCRCGRAIDCRSWEATAGVGEMTSHLRDQALDDSRQSLSFLCDFGLGKRGSEVDVFIWVRVEKKKRSKTMQRRRRRGQARIPDAEKAGLTRRGTREKLSKDSARNRKIGHRGTEARKQVEPRLEALFILPSVRTIDPTSVLRSVLCG